MKTEHLSISLVRGLSILSEFSHNCPQIGTTEMAKRLGLNKSTVHRYAETLKTLGYLEQDPETRKYRLGFRVIHLGLAALNSMELRQIGLPHLETLATECGYTVNMGILEGDEVTIVERVRISRIINIDLHVGSRLPAYCTSMGKVLLAFLPAQELETMLGGMVLDKRGPNTIVDRVELIEEFRRIREQGFGVNNQELAAGLRSVAAPVRSSNGEVVAAINMAIHTSTVSTDEMLDILAPKTIATAKAISRKLGYRD